MKKNNKYFVIDSEGNYLIKGNINNKPFDGNNAPIV